MGKLLGSMSKSFHKFAPEEPVVMFDDFLRALAIGRAFVNNRIDIVGRAKIILIVEELEKKYHLKYDDQS